MSSLDAWPSYHIASADHLQAIGAISANFNEYEHELFELLNAYMPNDLLMVTVLVETLLAKKKRRQLIGELADFLDHDTSLRNSVTFALNHFAICADNRNIVLHSTLNADPAQPDPVRLHKRNKQGQGRAYDLSLNRAQEMADEMRDGRNFVYELRMYRIKAHAGQYPNPFLTQPGAVTLPQLPTEPSAPHQLTPLP